MPYYKHERHGTHIADINDRETLEKAGWVLVDQTPQIEMKFPDFLEPVQSVDKEPETVTIAAQVEPEKRKPGRKPKTPE